MILYIEDNARFTAVISENIRQCQSFNAWRTYQIPYLNDSVHSIWEGIPGPFWCKMTVVIFINKMILIFLFASVVKLHVLLNKHIRVQSCLCLYVITASSCYYKQ